jgi:signal transduction histidine kinase
MGQHQGRRQREATALLVEVVGVLVVADEHHIDETKGFRRHRRAGGLGEVTVLAGLVKCWVDDQTSARDVDDGGGSAQHAEAETLSGTVSAPGSIAARLRDMALNCTVAAPIIVDGRVWGMAAVGSSEPEPLPADTEARLGNFADLIATAIANAATRGELIVSRARIVTAADEARRRLERDLHDGAQQRLVAVGLQLSVAEDSVPSELDDLKQQLARIQAGLRGVSDDLREISRGIHPAILSRGGLGPALKTLARRSAVPVSLDFDIGRRLPESAEVAAYYVVAEALTNAAKHSHASEVRVHAHAEDANLYLSIQDDGVGGADLRKGSGLIGLIDRVEAFGGHLKIVSPPDRGTSLSVILPFDG